MLVTGTLVASGEKKKKERKKILLFVLLNIFLGLVGIQRCKKIINEREHTIDKGAIENIMWICS